MATFEDMGYFCIDNLPPQMVPRVVELFSLEGSRVSRVALVFDVRGGSYFEELGQALEYLRETGIASACSTWRHDEALVARYQATRRPHPLSEENLPEGIAQRAPPARAVARAGRHGHRHHRHVSPGAAASPGGDAVWPSD